MDKVISPGMTFGGKPVQMEINNRNHVENLDGAKVVLVEKTPVEVISCVTGESLGKKEIIIGSGTIKNGKASIVGPDGTITPITVKVEAVFSGKDFSKKVVLKRFRTRRHKVKPTQQPKSNNVKPLILRVMD